MELDVIYSIIKQGAIQQSFLMQQKLSVFQHPIVTNYNELIGRQPKYNYDVLKS